MILIHGFRRRCATTPPVATTRGPVGAEEAERSIGAEAAERSIGAEEAEGAAGPKKSRCLRGQRGGSAIEEEQAADQSVLVSEAEWRSGGAAERREHNHQKQTRETRIFNGAELVRVGGMTF